MLDQTPPYYSYSGLTSGPPIVFIAEPGPTTDYFTLLISTLGLDRNFSLHHFCLGDNAQSPKSDNGTLLVPELAEDVRGMFADADITPAYPATILAHSMANLATLSFVARYPALVKNLILLNPPLFPLSGPTVPTKIDIRSLEKVPMLVITGADHEVASAHSWLELSRRTRDCRCVVLPSGGCWHSAENIDELSREVNSFLGYVEAEWLSDTYFLIE